MKKILLIRIFMEELLISYLGLLTVGLSWAKKSLGKKYWAKLLGKEHCWTFLATYCKRGVREKA